MYNMRFLIFVTLLLFSSACLRETVVVNELLLEKIGNGKYEQNQIIIDSIIKGKWNTLILMPPYFPPDSLSNCGVEKDIIRKIKRYSPLQLDIEELRVYAVYSNKVYGLKNIKGQHMLVDLAMKGCPIFKKGDLLGIKNITKDSLYIDFRLYKKE
jgi:hypothetical protein